MENRRIDAKEQKAQVSDHIEMKLKQYNQDLIKIKDENELERLQNNIKPLGYNDADELIADEVLKLAMGNE